MAKRNTPSTSTLARTTTSAPKRVNGAGGATREPGVDEIARVAYARFAARGYQDGHDVEDWLAAEAELRGTP